MPTDRTNDRYVRNVSPELWHRLRVESVQHGLTLGSLLSTVIEEWLAQHQCSQPMQPQEQER